MTGNKMEKKQQNDWFNDLRPLSVAHAVVRCVSVQL